MSVIDIIIIIPILWGIYKGFKKGLIIEIATFLALIIGIYGAMKLYGATSNLIEDQINASQKYLPLIAFSLTFIAIVIGIHLLAKLLDKLIKAVALGIVNRIAGGIFGGLKFFLIVAAFLLIIDKIDNKTHFLEEKTKSDSLLYKPSLNLIYWVFPIIYEVKETDFTPDINIDL
jgi:membrane protein required for colicin V production